MPNFVWIVLVVLVPILFWTAVWLYFKEKPGSLDRKSNLIGYLLLGPFWLPFRSHLTLEQKPIGVRVIVGVLVVIALMGLAVFLGPRRN
jgi:hypothetical protein